MVRNKTPLKNKPHMNKLEDQHHQLKGNTCRKLTTVNINYVTTTHSLGEQCWHSGMSPQLPPMCPGFEFGLVPYVG